MSFDKKKVIGAVVGVLAVGAIATSIYCSGYEYGETFIVDKEGNKVVDKGFGEIIYDENCPDYVAQYRVNNRWPEWSLFYRDKYGLIDLKTGEMTKPKFSHQLVYREDGLAWDYDGHLVDAHGNVVVDCKFYKKDGRFLDNPRKFALHTMKNANKKNINYIINNTDDLQNENALTKSENYDGYDYIGTYSDNGWCSFYSGGKYGYMDREGNVVLPPTYYRAGTFSEKGLAIAGDDYFHGLGIINEKGEYVVEPEYEDIRYDSDIDCYFTRNSDGNGLIDSEGNILLECNNRSLKYFPKAHIFAVGHKYMDENLNVLFESKYLAAGYSPVMKMFYFRMDDPDNRSEFLYGVMDDQGNILIEPGKDSLYFDYNGLLVIGKDDNYEVYTSENGSLTLVMSGVDTVSFYPIGDQSFYVKKESDGLEYYYDKTGNKVSDEGFAEAETYFEGNYGIVYCSDEQFAVISSDLEVVSDHSADAKNFECSYGGAIIHGSEEESVIFNDGSRLSSEDYEKIVSVYAGKRGGIEPYCVVKYKEGK